MPPKGLNKPCVRAVELVGCTGSGGVSNFTMRKEKTGIWYSSVAATEMC